MTGEVDVLDSVGSVEMLTVGFFAGETGAGCTTVEVLLGWI
jgi:hypothetical protein